MSKQVVAAAFAVHVLEEFLREKALTKRQRAKIESSIALLWAAPLMATALRRLIASSKRGQPNKYMVAQAERTLPRVKPRPARLASPAKAAAK